MRGDQKGALKQSRPSRMSPCLVGEERGEQPRAGRHVQPLSLSNGDRGKDRGRDRDSSGRRGGGRVRGAGSILLPLSGLSHRASGPGLMPLVRWQ